MRWTSTPRRASWTRSPCLAENELADSFADADRNPPVFDPETKTAPVPASFKKSYQAFMDSEYWRLGLP